MMYKASSIEWDQLSGHIAASIRAESRLGEGQVDEAAALARDRDALLKRASVLLGLTPGDQIVPSRSATVPAPSFRVPPIGPIDDRTVAKSPRSPRVADLRRVAQTLATRWFLGATRRSALSIISADRHEGRSSVAANLACIFAQSGVPTLLIDADLHNPVIHTKFELAQPRQPGAIHCAVEDVENLSVVPAATLLDLKYDRFMQSALQALVEVMSREFQVVLVDTAAASTSNDYQTAALATGGALCVTREGATRARRAARMLDLCDDAGITVVGGVMVKS